MNKLLVLQIITLLTLFCTVFISYKTIKNKCEVVEEKNAIISTLNRNFVSEAICEPSTIYVGDVPSTIYVDYSEIPVSILKDPNDITIETTKKIKIIRKTYPNKDIRSYNFDNIIVLMDSGLETDIGLIEGIVWYGVYPGLYKIQMEKGSAFEWKPIEEEFFNVIKKRIE